MMPTNSKEQKH